MSSLFWIEVTLVGGQNVPVRVDDIDYPLPESNGATLYFRTPRPPLKVTQTAEQVGDLIATLRDAWLTAVTGV
jgi:hypothetical protein